MTTTWLNWSIYSTLILSVSLWRSAVLRWNSNDYHNSGCIQGHHVTRRSMARPFFSPWKCTRWSLVGCRWGLSCLPSLVIAWAFVTMLASRPACATSHGIKAFFTCCRGRSFPDVLNSGGCRLNHVNSLQFTIVDSDGEMSNYWFSMMTSLDISIWS